MVTLSLFRHCSAHISFLVQYQGVGLIEFSEMIEVVVVRGAGPIVMDEEIGLKKEVDLKKDVGLQKEVGLKKEVGLIVKKVDNGVFVIN